MPIEDFIINMYCCVVDEYNALIKNPQMLRRRGYAPKLTDAEVIAMELVGEFLSLDFKLRYRQGNLEILQTPLE